MMKISNVTHGSINHRNNTMLITVASSDHPYGLFQFENQQISVKESQGLVTLKVIRSYGTFDVIRVNYQILMSQSGKGKAEFKDISDRDGYVDFSEGESSKVINIAVVDDDMPEGDEEFAVNITSVLILKPSTGIHIVTMFFICSCVKSY